MCKVYNPIGCLTFIKTHLHQHNIKEFKSLNEVIAFQKGYEPLRQQIISNSEAEIENEKRNLFLDNLKLTDAIECRKIEVQKEILEEIVYLKLKLENLSAIPRNAWQRILNSFEIFFLNRKISRKEATLPLKVSQSVRESMDKLNMNESRYNQIISNFNYEVKKNCLHELNALERKKGLIDVVNHSIMGAIGEQKVVKELEKLHDDYTLINDFCLYFSPAIYNLKEKEYIKSIQADHVLIAPSGVFLIETKNWSEHSVKNLSLRSPIEQLRRTSFALSTVLRNRTANYSLNYHHWGKKRIPIRNLVVLINNKPREEFEYVKLLSLNELLNYIMYFPPIFTKKETENIATDLIFLSRKKHKI